MLRDRSTYPYQSFFCEENVWQLIKTHKDESFLLGAKVLFFINRHATVWMTCQKALGNNHSGVWDYHVVLFLARDRTIVDFDSALGFQTGVKEYCKKSFQGFDLIPREWKALVRAIDAKDYLHHFTSDRNHMVDDMGNHLAPFPDWDPIINHVSPLSLAGLVDVDLEDPRFTDRTLPRFVENI